MGNIIFRLIGRGVRDLGLNPWAQLLTLAAVILVSFLSGLFLLGVVNLSQELQVTRGEVAFQIFWKPDTSLQVVQSHWKKIQNLPHMKSLQTFTPEEALQALTTGVEGTDTRWLQNNNPLPPTAVLRFVPQNENVAVWAEQTKEFLMSLPGVNVVKFNPLKNELGDAWRSFSHIIMWPVLIFLGVILALVVGNTIKLSLLHRKDEIEILQLVGARNWFIRLPLLIGGAIQGITGGSIAVLLLWGAWYHMKDILHFPPLFIQLSFLSVEHILLLILIPAGMGIVSSWVAVQD